MEKLTKLGITSLSVMALGAVAPLVAPDVFGANVVYAEERTARTLSVSDASYDANGIYLPTVDLGLTQLVNVTPDTPYTVNQPEIDGWDNYVISYSKGDSSFHKEMKNGDQITYDDLFEDDEGTYGGVLIYSYKQPQPASDQPTAPVKPEKPAENIETNRKINFNYYEYGSVNQPEGINGPSTVTVAPGETYSLPNIEVPNHYLYRIDSNLTGVEDVKPGHKINYDSLPDTYDGADVYYIYKQGTKPEESADQPTTPVKPETSTNKPTTGTVIRIGDQPTSPADETSLYYTIERRFGDPNDGVGWVVEEKPNINAGETHEVEGLSEKTKPWTTYRIMEGTPESYTITYDDVKAGKNHFVFRMYNTRTHNPDGTLKTEEKPATPADKPAEQPTKPAEEPQDQSRDIYIGYAIYGDVKRPEGLTSETGTIETTATLNPGESYTFPNVTAPGYKLLGIYDETDKNIGVGGTINYEDIKYHENLEAYVKQVFYVYEPSTTLSQPEKPADQPQTPPEVPATKPETPAEKPSDKPAEQPTEEPAKPEVPATKPETPAEKPSDKPATKPTDTNKPVVNPADTGKPEVKPAQQSGTAVANAQTPAPKADAKAPATAAPKADKPAEKKMETLPNTGESQSTLALLGLALGVLGLQGLTYKGRHDRKR